jgi:nucleoside-diphosphate-sugar epimerase
LAAAGHNVVAHYHLRQPQLPPIVTETFRASLEALEALPSGIEAVVHAAARSLNAGYSDHDLIVSNVIGMDRLLRCSESASVSKIVFLSSISVFGDVTTDVVNETVLQGSPDVYGTSKYLGERMLTSIAGTIPSVSLRLPGVLGRGAARHWLARTVDALRQHRPVTIFNPEAPFNNAVHVNDLGRLVDGLIASSLSGSTVLTLGAAGSLSIGEVIARLKERLKSQSPIHVGSSSARRPFTIDSRKAQDDFGYRPMQIGTMLDVYADETAD